MNRFAILFILTALSVTPHLGDAQTISTAQPAYASALQLVTTPERYDGKLVSVIGFLGMEHEGDLLFVHEEDQKHLILSNSVRVDGTKQMFKNREQLDMKYVKLLGVFRAGDRVKDPLIVGTLTDVTSCEVWSDPKNPLSRRLLTIPGISH